MLMHGDLVYLQVGDEQGSAVIWNCREDWYIPGPCLSGGTHLSQQYLFIGDALVGLDQESASIWDLVPRLDKENRRNLETSIPHIRLREVPPDLIPACVSRHQDHCNIPDFSAPSVWYHNRSPLYIDAFRLSNNGERNGCARYRLDVARFPGFSTITAELSRTATFTFPPNSSFSTPYNPTHHISPGFTSGALVKSYQDSGHWSMDPTPYCLYSVPGDGFEDSPGSSSQANHVAKLTKLFSYEGEWSRYLGLCTWSGRMLYGGRDTTLSTLAGARPRPVIYVVDYLSL
ncbi:hypothetical protein DFP72DRAFT_556243 [Ephemerocybe angulata]|uniref:Uncharacterized protein n=1 Tax=Ephemerocybe angulata TaxID=980116 RepID=A0A8H6M1D5_9AGAR|nr:hypothetical protein DFP72DRAFT_556243 [Tulosesus angulatus]